MASVNVDGVPIVAEDIMTARDSDVASIDAENTQPVQWWDRYPKHLIRPYEPDPAVDWENVTAENGRLTRTWLGSFHDDAVADEFRRYMFRDFMAVLGSVAHFIGAVVYPPLMLFDFGPYTIMYHLFPVVFAIVGAAEVAFQFFLPNTVQYSKIRAMNAAIVLIVMSVETSISIHHDYKHCDNANDIVQTWFGVQRPPVTPERMDRFCHRVISPFPAIATACVVNVVRVTPSAAVASVLMDFLLELITRPIEATFEADPQANDARGIIALSTIFTGAVGLAIFAARHMMLMRQFELAVEVERETRLSRARERDVDRLLCQTVPGAALTRLTRGEQVLDATSAATVLFSDMVGFTAWSSSRSPAEVVDMLNTLCIKIDAQAITLGVERVKTIGDAYWAVVGLPEPDEFHADVMCEFALEMVRIVATENNAHPAWGGNVRLRIGVHSGPLEGGILGRQQLSYEVFGPTNDVAQMAEQRGVPGRVVVTEATNKLLTNPMQERVTEQGGGIRYTHDDGGSPLRFQLFLLSDRTDEDDKQKRFASHKTASGSVNKANSWQKHHHRRGSGSVNHPGTAGDGTSPDKPFADDDTPGEEKRTEVTLLDVPSAHPPPRHHHGGRRSSVVLTAPPGHRTPSEHTASHSVSVKPPNDAAERARQERRAFIEQRAAARRNATSDGQSVMNEEESLALLKAKYSKRKHDWLFFDFADADVEAEYREWVLPATYHMRLLARVLFAAFNVVYLLSLAIERRRANPVSWALLTIALVMSLGLIASTVIGKTPLANALVHYAAVVVVAVGWGLVDPDLVPGSSDSVVGNDITFTHGVLSLLWDVASVSVFGLATMTLLNLAVLLPLYIYFVSDTILFSTNIIFLLLGGGLIVAMLILILERNLRQQFLDWHVQQFFRASAATREQEQAALLASIVPAHAVTPLMAWMATDFDPAKCIAQAYTDTVVGFVRLHRPRDAADGGHWLLAAHQEIDRRLEPYRAVTKVKTIGDTVMLAGTFELDKYGPSDAVASVVHAALAVRAAGLQTKIGIHIGDVQGAVLGTTRLCFDIFGDAVNVASRVMYAAEVGGDVWVTDEFASRWPDAPPESLPTDAQDARIVFSTETREIVAKGKGVLKTRSVSRRA